jgi:sec-independent protein translocase protein TatA
MNIGGLGPMELMIILVIVLVLFGARRVPEIGASIGKGIREFKRNISDVGKEVRNEIDDSPRAADRLSAPTPDTMRTRDADAERVEPKRLL